jgi:hypothetical protein
MVSAVTSTSREYAVGDWRVTGRVRIRTKGRSRECVQESWKHGKMDALVRAVSCSERSVYNGPNGPVEEPQHEKSYEGTILRSFRKWMRGLHDDSLK